MGDSEELVLYELSEGSATLTLNRPERRNAWTIPLEDRYFDLLDECDADPEVRAIILTASGTTFCPGLDAQRLSNLSTGDARRLNLDGRRPQTYPLRIRKPMIAAINGAAAGIGLMQRSRAGGAAPGCPARGPGSRRRRRAHRGCRHARGSSRGSAAR